MYIMYRLCIFILKIHVRYITSVYVVYSSVIFVHSLKLVEHIGKYSYEKGSFFRKDYSYNVIEVCMQP